MKILYILRGTQNENKNNLADSISTYSIQSDDFLYDDEGNFQHDKRNSTEKIEWSMSMLNEWMEENVEKIVVKEELPGKWELGPYHKLAEKHNYQVFSMIVDPATLISR